MRISNSFKYAFFASVLVLAGCAQLPGEKQGAEPPRLVKLSEKVDGKTVERLVWDNAQSFGAVPAVLAAKAERTCKALNTDRLQWRATGYHASALDADGKRLAGGGYFCKSNRP